MLNLLIIEALIAALGLLLLVLVATAVARDLLPHFRAQHRSGNKAMDEQLRWGLVVDDGIVVNQDGSLMAGWKYTGKDSDTLTADEKNAFNEQINGALKHLGTGWMVHVDAVRRKAPTYPRSDFPDSLTQGQDDERRRYFGARGTSYETDFFLTLTYLAPGSVQRRGARLVFGEDGEALRTFKETAYGFARELPLTMRPLRRRDKTLSDGETVQVDDFLSYLHYRATGDLHDIHVPEGISAVSSVVGAVPYEHGRTPRVGDKYIRVVAVEGFPARNMLARYDALGEFVGEYTWTTRFIFLDQHQALRKLEFIRNKWREKILPFTDKLFEKYSGRQDEHAKMMVADATGAITDLADRSRAGGLLTSTITILDRDPQAARQTASHLCDLLRHGGLSGARDEGNNITDAFFGSLPGHGTENLRRLSVNTRNLADLMPTSSIFSGSPTAPCPMYPPDSPPLMHVVAQGRTPYRLNLHYGDLGNTLIIGPPGSGKSTLLATLAAQLRRYPGMCVYAFDKGMSLYPLTSGIWAATRGKSGLHFNVGSSDGLAFAPLQHVETTEDVVWALNWLDTLLALNGVQSTPAQRNQIGQELKAMHARGIRSLAGLTATIQDHTVQEVLQTYTTRGTVGKLLDAEEDGLQLSDFTVFEIDELMALQDKFALPVLLYLFRRIERSLKGQPAAIILDEAWLMLGHPVFRQKLWEWLKTMRKANCIVIMATQSLADASESGIFEQLKEAIGSRIFLANPNARSEDGQRIYRSMGLGRRDVERVASAKPKTHYYHITPEGQRLFELALGPLAMAFCGASTKQDLATIQQLRKRHGHRWVEPWLKQRSVRNTLQHKAAA